MELSLTVQFASYFLTIRNPISTSHSHRRVRYSRVPNLHLEQDSATPSSALPVDWLIGKLDWGDTLRSWIPTGFESYVRILHPAYERVRGEGIEVAQRVIPWSTLSEWSGRPLDATSHVLDLLFDADGNEWSEHGQRGHVPLQGQLDSSLLAELLLHLSKRTTSPDEIWMLIWTGFGGPTDTVGLPIEISEQLLRSGREYVLRRGSIVSSPEEHGDSIFEHAPSFWWPDDRAWFVSSDIDSSSTYVGGSRELIEQILSDLIFESFRADLDDWYNGLLVNRPPIMNVKIGFRRRLRLQLNHYLFHFGRKPSSGSAVYREKRWWEWWLKP